MLVEEVVHLLAARKQGYGMGVGVMLRTRHHLPNTTLMTYFPCSDVPRLPLPQNRPTSCELFSR